MLKKPIEAWSFESTLAHFFSPERLLVIKLLPIQVAGLPKVYSSACADTGGLAICVTLFKSLKDIPYGRHPMKSRITTQVEHSHSRFLDYSTVKEARDYVLHKCHGMIPQLF